MNKGFFIFLVTCTLKITIQSSSHPVACTLQVTHLMVKIVLSVCVAYVQAHMNTHTIIISWIHDLLKNA